MPYWEKRRTKEKRHDCDPRQRKKGCPQHLEQPRLSEETHSSPQPDGVAIRLGRLDRLPDGGGIRLGRQENPPFRQVSAGSRGKIQHFRQVGCGRWWWPRCLRWRLRRLRPKGSGHHKQQLGSDDGTGRRRNEYHDEISVEGTDCQRGAALLCARISLQRTLGELQGRLRHEKGRRSRQKCDPVPATAV